MSSQQQIPTPVPAYGSVPVPDTLNYRQYNLTTPNPFSLRPIETTFTTNDLLLQDPNMRINALTMVEDIGMMESTSFVSPMHLNPGWKWK